MPAKLTYFPVKGAAELTRYIAAYGSIDYEDNRIKETKSGQGINGHLGDVWGTMKATSPLGNVPILTMEDGSEYSQSVAIARYFANKAGIAGQTEDEKLHADMIVDLVRSDMMPLLVKTHFEKDEEKKKTMAAEARQKIDAWLAKVEANCVKGESSILASGLSWADIALFNIVTDLFHIVDMQLGPQYTKLQAVIAKVGEEPKIKEWIEKRPVTPM